ncbi:MAG TPA: phosphate acetyltransferase [Vicinamibacteria bacterium]|nr:phosphate acetyltransferase [Vicinamibacteria bacterium]
MFMIKARTQVKGKGARIVYAEGLEERALRAAALLRDQDLLRPVLVGPEAEVRGRARALGIDMTGIEVHDPRSDAKAPAYAAAYHEVRKHKGVSPEAAAEKASLPHYFGALMVHAGDALGMVSGLSSETKPFLPAFEVIKLQKGYTRASSVFVMEWPERVLFYADCSVNIEPDPATLAEIGRATALTARAFGFEPRVAFLSFSTRDSASHERVDRVKEAVRLCRAAGPDFPIDGEIQFDAAFLPAVAKKKAPDSPFAEGAANVFIFPNLDAGNIAYKLTERLAGAAAIGPVLQGLNKPVNDVSRGCSVQDLADVAVITAVQAGVS